MGINPYMERDKRPLRERGTMWTPDDRSDDTRPDLESRIYRNYLGALALLGRVAELVDRNNLAERNNLDQAFIDASAAAAEVTQCLKAILCRPAANGETMNMWTPEVILQKRQEAGAEVERKMIEFLIQFTPARGLTVADVHCIANVARTYAFDAMPKIFES